MQVSVSRCDLLVTQSWVDAFSFTAGHQRIVQPLAKLRKGDNLFVAKLCVRLDDSRVVELQVDEVFRSC